MRRSDRPVRALIAGACLIFGLWEIWAVFIRETPALTIEGAHPWFANEFGEGAQVSETFEMSGNGLTAVDVRFSTDRPVTLIVRCELSQLYTTDPGRTWFATIKRVSGVEWRRIQFPPIEWSNANVYTLGLQLIAAVPIDAAAPQATHDRPSDKRPRVALVISKDNVLGGGLLFIADSRRIGSLSLRAFTRQRTAYGRFRVDVTPKLPPALRHAAVDVLLAIAYQWALLTVIYSLVVGQRGGSAPAASHLQPREL